MPGVRVGASAWDYYVQYQDDLPNAFGELRAKVLREGDFYWHGDWAPGGPAMPATKEELWGDGWAQESGTHSILDVSRWIGSGEPDGLGTMRPLTDAEVETYLGGDRPTRSDFAVAFNKGGGVLAGLGERWSGFCTVLYSDEGEPAEIAFWGASGD